MSEKDNSSNIALATTIFALVSSIIGSVLLIGDYNGEPSLGLFLFFLILGIGDLALLASTKLLQKVNFFSISLVICYFALTFGFIINTKAHFGSVFALILLGAFMNVSLTSDSLKEHFAIRYFMTGVYFVVGKILGVFQYFKELSEAVRKPELKLSQTSKNVVDIFKTFLIFVGIGIPLIILIVTLLSASNDEFGRIVSNIFSFNFDFGINIIRAIFVVFVSAYVISDIYFLKQYKKFEQSVNRNVSVSLSSSKIYLRAAGLTLIILNIFYFFFCIAELRYDFGNAKSLLLLKGVESYSAFAVSRFWELITVGIINLVIFYFLTGSYKKLDKDNSSVLRPLVLVNFVALFINSLGLILSVNARLFLYESGYGLTDKRLYAHLFIFVLAAIFVLFMIGVFVKNHSKLQLASITALFLFFSIYTAAPTDYFIAKANYELAKSRSIQKYDPAYDAGITYCSMTEDPDWYMKSLDLEPSVLRKYDSTNEGLFVIADLLKENEVEISLDQKVCLEKAIKDYKEGKDFSSFFDEDEPQSSKKRNWREWNLSRYLLEKKLEQVN